MQLPFITRHKLLLFILLIALSFMSLVVVGGLIFSIGVGCSHLYATPHWLFAHMSGIAGQIFYNGQHSYGSAEHTPGIAGQIFYQGHSSLAL